MLAIAAIAGLIDRERTGRGQQIVVRRRNPDRQILQALRIQPGAIDDGCLDGRPAIQFERLVGELTWWHPTRYVRVAREGPAARFVPVKEVEDLDRYAEALSALFDLDPSLPASVLDPSTDIDPTTDAPHASGGRP